MGIPLEQWTVASLLQDTKNGPLLAPTRVNGRLLDPGEVNVMLPDSTSVYDPVLHPRYNYGCLGF